MSAIARARTPTRVVRVHFRDGDPRWVDIDSVTGDVYTRSGTHTAWEGTHLKPETVRVGCYPFIDRDGVGIKLLPHIRRVVRIDHDIRAKCKVCSCTHTDACVTNGTPCHWAGINLCSACT